MTDADRRKALRRETQALREETRVIKAKTQTIKDATEALREALRRARPTSPHRASMTRPAKRSFSVTWALPADARAFFTLNRDLCAAADQPVMAAYCDELLSRLPEARH